MLRKAARPRSVAPGPSVPREAPLLPSPHKKAPGAARHGQGQASPSRAARRPPCGLLTDPGIAGGAGPSFGRSPRVPLRGDSPPPSAEPRGPGPASAASLGGRARTRPCGPLPPLAAAGGVAVAAGLGELRAPPAADAAMLPGLRGGLRRLLLLLGPARAYHGDAAAAVGSQPDAGSSRYQVGRAGRGDPTGPSQPPPPPRPAPPRGGDAAPRRAGRQRHRGPCPACSSAPAGRRAPPRQPVPARLQPQFPRRELEAIAPVPAPESRAARLRPPAPHSGHPRECQLSVFTLSLATKTTLFAY